MKLQELRSAPQLNRRQRNRSQKKKKRRKGREERGGSWQLRFPVGLSLFEQKQATWNSFASPNFNNYSKKKNCRYGLSKGTYVKVWIIASIQYTTLQAYQFFWQRNRVLQLERRNPSTSILLQALSSQLSSPGIEEKAEGNGLPRLQIYEYGHLGTGNGAAGLELV